jgi:hypothetical protein
MNSEIQTGRGRYISFQDPDYAPGAIEIEANARSALRSRQNAAVLALDKLFKKHGLKAKFRVGTVLGIAGDFIRVDCKPSTLKGTDVVVDVIDVTYRNGSDVLLYINKVIPRSDKLDLLNAQGKVDLRVYDGVVQRSPWAGDDRYVINLGCASGNFSDPATVKAADRILKGIVEILKSSV